MAFEAFASIGFAVLFDQPVSISWKAFSASGWPVQTFWMFTVAQTGSAFSGRFLMAMIEPVAGAPAAPGRRRSSA